MFHDENIMSKLFMDYVKMSYIYIYAIKQVGHLI